MKKQKTSSPATSTISAWLLWMPIKFAIISFILMVLCAGFYGIIATLLHTSSHTMNYFLGIMVALCIIGTTVFTLRGLPRTNFDRKSFVALTNIQMLFMAIIFIGTAAFIASKSQQLMLYLLLLETRSTAAFMGIIVLISVFYLYLSGLFISSTYAKFRRARAMGIPAWKIILTIPCSLPMLWLAGYLIPENTAKTPAITLRSKWYSRVTDVILTSNTKAVITITLLLVMCGYFFGLQTTILTLLLGIVFALWLRATGTQKFIKNIGGTYATTAVCINIVMLLVAFILFTYHAIPEQKMVTTMPNIAQPETVSTAE